MRDVEVDTSAFDLAVRRFTTELGIDFVQAVKTSMRQLAQELMRWTFPRSQAQGRAAVKRDINNAMWLPNVKNITNRRLAKLIKDEDHEGVAAFMKNSGNLRNYRLEKFNLTLHTSIRNYRGRVPRFQKVMVLERSAYNQYVREVQGHVGSTKFAWGDAARRLGASIPNWILRHSSRNGTYTESFRDVENPFVEVVNRGKGIGSLSPSIVQQVINVRTRAMERDVEQVLKGRASRYFDKVS